jgi:AsmA protein
MTRRLQKIAAWALAGLAGLVLLLWLAIRLLVDPNEYKVEMQAAFREATGRELTLTGPLSLSYFPWLSVATDDATVGNRAGFAEEPFARLGRVQLGIRAWPLLASQRLEFGPVEVRQLELNLAVAGDGSNNWSDLLDRLEDEPATTVGAGDAGTKPKSFELSIASLELRQASVSFLDQQTGARYLVSNVELETGTLRRGVPVDVRTALAVSRNGRDIGRFELETQFDATQDGVLALVDTTGRLRFAPSNKAVQPIKLRAPRIELRTATSEIDAAVIEATVAEATLRTSLHFRQGRNGPELRGSFTVPAINPRELLRALGSPAPPTRDPKALGRFEARGDVSFSKGRGLQLKPLTLRLDDTTLEGRLALADFDRKSVRFDLRGTALDLDRYFAIGHKPSAAGPVTGTADRETGFESWRELDLEGTASLDRLQLAGIDLRNVDVGVRARDGRIHVDPFRARAFGGRASSSLTVDVRGNLPAVHLEQRLEGVDVGAMLDQLGKVRQVEGRGRAHFVLDSQGPGVDALFNALRGTFDLTVEDGALLGTDLGYEIERALGAAQLRQPSGVNTGRTDFKTLRGKGTLAGRTLRTQDLEFVSDIATVRGRGDIDYGRNRLDLDLTARLLKVPPGRMFGIKLSRVENVDIPMAVTGPIDAPKVRPDVNALLQAIAKSSLQEPLEGRIKQGLKDLLGL